MILYYTIYIVSGAFAKGEDMGYESREKSIVPTFLITASLVIIIAGMKLAAEIIVPFLLALFATLLIAPLMHWLVRKGLGRTWAFLLVTTLTLLVFVSITGAISAGIAELALKSETLEAQLRQTITGAIAWLGQQGIAVEAKMLLGFIDPGKIFAFTMGLLKSTSSLLSDSVLIFFTLIFMLVESFVLGDKIKAIATKEWHSVEHLHAFAGRLSQYFAIKAQTSLATAVWIFSVLYFMDVPYAILWSIGGFFLNFVPVIGSIIAAIPPVLIALATQGFGSALWVGGWFVVINTVIGNVVEPKIMGKGLGLSELVVFVSLVVWGWVFGKVGMLLAVPLTMVVKFGLESSEKTAWLAVLISDKADASRKDQSKNASMDEQ